MSEFAITAVFFVTLVAFIVWLVIGGCGDTRTFLDRSRALDAIRDYLIRAVEQRSCSPQSIQKLYDDFSSVSYGSHFWRVISFRNPWELYSQDIRDILGE